VCQRRAAQARPIRTQPNQTRTGWQQGKADYAYAEA
jgi:hypothetical protein